MPTCVPRTATGAQASAFNRGRLLTIAATVIAWCVLAVENGAQPVQTDWAVAGPAPIAAGPTSADLRQQMILDNIFFVDTPILHNRAASPASPVQSEPETAWLRFAVRPDGVDGWRPASQHVEPLNKSHRPPLSYIIAVDPSATTQARLDKDAAPTALPGDELTAPHAPAPPSGSESITNSADSLSSDVTADDAPSVPSDEAFEPDGESDDSAVPAETNGSQPQSNTSPAQPSQASPPPKPLPPLTRQLTNLRSRVRGVLKGYYRKQLNSREHDPWEVMHGMLAYGVQSRIRQGGPRGELITSVGWLCYNKPCKGQTLMHVTREGELRAKYGVGLQGHLGQLLAMLAQCHVSADYPIHVGKHQFTIQDLIEAEKETCYPKSELTFKLLAFQHYLDLNDKWMNDRGEEWDFERLIAEELAQPIRGAACGGTHRLSSLSLTVKARVRRGEPLDGEYARAAEFVEKYHHYAFQLQNRDGSLSTSWFRGRGDESDIDRRIKTTGHILEWLCYSLSDEELRDQRTIRAVSYLANLMYSNYDNEWEVGPMCHATHALLLYDERVFQPYDRPGYAVSYRPRPATAARPPRYSNRR